MIEAREKLVPEKWNFLEGEVETGSSDRLVIAHKFK
jgi:hypothetical protein